MRWISYINEEKAIEEKRKESTGLGADGLSKQRLKTAIYKATKKCTHNKLYSDKYWQGPQCVWDTFNDMNLNWHLTKSEYKTEKGKKMPSSKEWHYEILWEDNKGKQQKMSGYLTAAGAGSVDDPLDKYDLVLINW